jgi:hypothetical protein
MGLDDSGRRSYASQFDKFMRERRRRELTATTTAKMTADTTNKTNPAAIGRCDYDAAGKLLDWIYGPGLNPKTNGKLTGSLIRFDH